MCDEAVLSRRWLNTCLPMGSSELIPYFVLLFCAAFALPVRLYFRVFSLLILHLILFLTPLRRGERDSGCVRLSCWLGLNHNI